MSEADIARKIAKDKLAQSRMDIESVLRTEEGRRVLWRIMGECGIHNDLPVDDHAVMAYKSGRRSIGLYIQSLIVDTDELALFTMMKEARNSAILEQERMRNDNGSNGSNTTDLDNPNAGDFIGTAEYSRPDAEFANL